MLKKLLAAATGCVIALGSLSIAPLTVSAETDYKGVKLPFTVDAPSNVSLTALTEADSLTTMNAAYSMDDGMCKWLSDAAESTTHDATMEKLKKEYGLEELFVNNQIDWAIDDPVNGWHYTKYWDGEEFTNDEGQKQWAGYGNDKDYHSRVGDWDITENGVYPQTVNDIWLFRGNTIHNDPGVDEEVRKSENEWFYGNDFIPGLKNQLKEDQYTLVEVDSETHDQAISIDWTKHTAYVRVRWAITVSREGEDRFPIFSDWSEPASYGKDAKAFEPYTKESLAPPVLTDIRYYPDDFNGYPQIACTLTVPDDLKNNLTNITSRGGGIRIEWEARLPGKEWVGQQGDGTITSGEHIVTLIFLAESIIKENSENGVSTPEVVLAKDSPVELRARYWCNQYASYNGEYLGEFYTDYSNVLVFGSQEMKHTEESAPKEASVVEESAPQVSEASKAIVSNEPKKAEHKCKICGFCPEPLGLCIFIWIAILVAIIIIVVVIIIIVLKKKKKEPAPQTDMPAAPPTVPMSTDENGGTENGSDK